MAIVSVIAYLVEPGSYVCIDCYAPSRDLHKCDGLQDGERIACDECGKAIVEGSGEYAQRMLDMLDGHFSHHHAWAGPDRRERDLGDAISVVIGDIVAGEIAHHDGQMAEIMDRRDEELAAAIADGMNDVFQAIADQVGMARAITGLPDLVGGGELANCLRRVGEAVERGRTLSREAIGRRPAAGSD